MDIKTSIVEQIIFDFLFSLAEFAKMNEDEECAVCHQSIPKGRVHYGGVSCYSCRAFFRRNTQREELPISKGEGRCRITYMDRKQCSSCRYTTCIIIGMRPELVLNENEKKRRFKKLLRKKEEEASNMTSSPEPRNSDDESLYERAYQMPPLEPIKTNSKSSILFPRVSPFPYPFHPSPPPCTHSQYSPQHTYSPHNSGRGMKNTRPRTILDLEKTFYSN